VDLSGTIVHEVVIGLSIILNKHKNYHLQTIYDYITLVNCGFIQVVQAYDMIEKENVAIKMQRREKSLLYQAHNEIDMLELINSYDSETKPCVGE